MSDFKWVGNSKRNLAALEFCVSDWPFVNARLAVHTANVTNRAVQSAVHQLELQGIFGAACRGVGVGMSYSPCAGGVDRRLLGADQPAGENQEAGNYWNESFFHMLPIC